MQLVVDIGNTETVLGLVDPGSGEVEEHWRLTTGMARTADELDHIRLGGYPGAFRELLGKLQNAWSRESDKF